MNRHFVLTFASTAAAVFCAAVMVSGKAYADDITIDTTPFASTRTRAEVKAELTAQPQFVRDGGSEWAMQHNEPMRLASGYTRQQALADYKASREEVSALTAEDSGSSYLMRHAMRGKGRLTVARSAR
jgi:hypothetical protein